jgi:hypothetical protein
MKGIGKMTFIKVKAKKSGRIILAMKEIMYKARNVGKEYSDGKMAVFMKESLKTMLFVGMGGMNGLIKEYM